MRRSRGERHVTIGPASFPVGRRGHRVPTLAVPGSDRPLPASQETREPIARAPERPPLRGEQPVRKTPTRRWARHLALPVFAAALVAALPIANSATTTAAPEKWSPLSPVNVAFGKSSPRHEVKAQLLSFNDFHGNIDPPTGSGGLVNGTPAGGVEYLATTVKKLRAEASAERQPNLTVAAGDLIGATPLVSAAFHDEPAIESMNKVGLDISSVGNHEFDEGVTELKRMQRGGCHPVDGCQDGDGFRGASFKYLAANVVDKKTQEPI